ncbi:Lysyl hydrolase/glycosyltransferase family 25 [Phaffia rhodozyma]|uniref:Lysyl hydrolase/glycosyltransferase family 25 n=1 Tax=Phaffia rhodozyma TaxID=264483 RepID=A0A0F7SNS7_PHARH|nr:Lysyl hydrolase/glycosyltransferase family 25 [Phaffia rhodozyma]
MSGGTTWSSIYVINMATRPDRKEHMELIAHALELNFTYIDAVLKDSPVVHWIMERMREELVVKDLTREGAYSPMQQSMADRLWDGKTWREYVLSSFDSNSTEFLLEGTNPDVQFDYPLWPPEAPLACYLSHLKTWHTALKNDDDDILILEDDIDAEFSLVERWREMTRSLAEEAEGWDIVYLGWILGQERVNKPTFHPGLRKSNHPMGTHAYSLSRRGLRRLNGLVHDLPNLFSAPVDHELPFKYVAQHYNMGTLQSFSATPAIIIPFSELGTDIGGCASKDWGGILADSTVERIAACKGHPLPKKNPVDIWMMQSVEDM